MGVKGIQQPPITSWGKADFSVSIWASRSTHSLSLPPVVCMAIHEPSPLHGWRSSLSVISHGFLLPSVCVSPLPNLGRASCFSKPLWSPLVPGDPLKLHLLKALAPHPGPRGPPFLQVHVRVTLSQVTETDKGFPVPLNQRKVRGSMRRTPFWLSDLERLEWTGSGCSWQSCRPALSWTGRVSSPCTGSQWRTGHLGSTLSLKVTNCAPILPLSHSPHSQTSCLSRLLSCKLRAAHLPSDPVSLPSHPEAQA